MPRLGVPCGEGLLSRSGEGEQSRAVSGWVAGHGAECRGLGLGVEVLSWLSGRGADCQGVGGAARARRGL